ncbi:MAG TPA: dienelactone hydrolase family protein [Acidimicrobiales bacterium]|jgi:carboxymethylenebutenolidase|nr:dienelactone hydrolase family protein [Acidimicrobiales bacterium]
MGDAPLSVHEPQGEPKGGVVVVQEAFGVNGHIEDVCRRFAEEGWLAVAPHLFHRSGDPKLGYGDMTVIRPHMEALSPDGILSDVDDAIARLAEAGIPMGKVGVVGFCMGGSVTLITAAHRPVGAAVTFYGGGVSQGRFGFPPLAELAPKLQAPWLGLFGDLDKGIPVEDVEKLRAAAATSAHPTEVVRYADADHGFHCDERASYNAAAATDAWARTLVWFDRHLAG